MATPTVQDFDSMADGDVIVVDDITTTDETPPGLPPLPADFGDGPLTPVGNGGTYGGGTSGGTSYGGASKIGSTDIVVRETAVMPMTGALVPIARALLIELAAEFIASEGPGVLSSLGSAINERIATVLGNRNGTRANSNPDGGFVDGIVRIVDQAREVVPDRAGTMVPKFCCTMLDKLHKDEARALELAMQPGSEACVYLETANVQRLFFLCSAAQQPEMVRACRVTSCGCHAPTSCGC